MIDPTDLLGLYREGDADLSPTPTAGPYGDDPEGAEILYPVDDPRIARPYSRTLASGAQDTINLRERPDYWQIGVRNTANSQVRLYQSEAPAGAPLTLDNGGSVTWPGTSGYLTIVSSGAATADVTILAIRGYPPIGGLIRGQ